MPFKLNQDRRLPHSATTAQGDKLAGPHRRLGEAVERGDVDRYDAFNRDFHSTLYRGTHNAFLADHAVTLRLRLAPFRRAQFRGKQRLAESYEEHDALVRQVLRGDGEEVARLMRAHMLTASATLAGYLGETVTANQPSNQETPAR